MQEVEGPRGTGLCLLVRAGELTRSRYPTGVSTHPSPSAVVSIGAYDRFNYGDLLFPLVLDHAARVLGYPAMTHATLRASDLSLSGAVATVDIRDALKGTPSGVILGGGEVLGATWGSAAASMIPAPFDLTLLAVRRWVSRRAFDAIGRRILGGASPTPYVPSDSSLEGVCLVANAIGASSLEQLEPAIQAGLALTLSKARFVSVRDEAGQSLLGRHGITSVVAPDSVSILADLRRFDGTSDQRGPLVVQASRAWLRGNAKELVESVLQLAPNHSGVRLLPIGLAGAHADAEGLQSLARHLEDRGLAHVELVRPHSVWEIAEVIAQSAVFVGTSLHGAITALAYGVPFVSLDQVGKLEAYLATWGGPVSASVRSASQLVRAVDEALHVSRGAREEYARQLAALSWANTERVLDAAHGV